MNFQQMYDSATPAQRAEFQRRHANCLKVVIALKLVIIAVLVFCFYG